MKYAAFLIAVGLSAQTQITDPALTSPIDNVLFNGAASGAAGNVLTISVTSAATDTAANISVAFDLWY